MCKLHKLQDTLECFSIYSEATEHVVTKAETDRTVNILDANCEEADIPAIIHENCQHLTQDQWNVLLKLLLEFEELFDGTFWVMGIPSQPILSWSLIQNHIMVKHSQFL